MYHYILGTQMSMSKYTGDRGIYSVLHLYFRPYYYSTRVQTKKVQEQAAIIIEHRYLTFKVRGIGQARIWGPFGNLKLLVHRFQAGGNVYFRLAFSYSSIFCNLSFINIRRIQFNSLHLSLLLLLFNLFNKPFPFFSFCFCSQTSQLACWIVSYVCSQAVV